MDSLTKLLKSYFAVGAVFHCKKKCLICLWTIQGAFFISYPWGSFLGRWCLFIWTCRTLGWGKAWFLSWGRVRRWSVFWKGFTGGVFRTFICVRAGCVSSWMICICLLSFECNLFPLVIVDFPITIYYQRPLCI
jgi:hypothetical protein